MKMRNQVTSNKGKIFDWFLNRYLNFMLWYKGINNDIEGATKMAAEEIKRIGKYL